MVTRLGEDRHKRPGIGLPSSTPSHRGREDDRQQGRGERFEGVRGGHRGSGRATLRVPRDGQCASHRQRATMASRPKAVSCWAAVPSSARQRARVAAAVREDIGAHGCLPLVCHSAVSRCGGRAAAMIPRCGRNEARASEPQIATLRVPLQFLNLARASRAYRLWHIGGHNRHRDTWTSIISGLKHHVRGV